MGKYNKNTSTGRALTPHELGIEASAHSAEITSNPFKDPTDRAAFEAGWHLAEATNARSEFDFAATATRAELIAEAGMLNNHPALVTTDHVTFMGFLDRDECEQHVEKLRGYVAKAEAVAA